MPDAATQGATSRAAPWSRRALARALDTGLAVALSCVLVWPLAWGTVSEAASLAGVSGVSGATGLLEVLRLLTDGGGTTEAVLAQLRPAVLGTVALQAVVVWLYEAVMTTATGVTPGKAAMRLRVAPDRGATLGPVPPPPAHPLLDRTVRMGVRALVVVGPPALAVLALTALALAVPAAVDAAELAIALALAVALLALRGRGVHGHLSGTRVVSFSWQEAVDTARERVPLSRIDEALGRVNQTARAQPPGSRQRPGRVTPARRG